MQEAKHNSGRVYSSSSAVKLHKSLIRLDTLEFSLNPKFEQY